MTTSTELDRVSEESSSLEVLPPQQPPSLVARQMLVAHAEMMQTAHQLATAMCNTQMVPVRFRGKPDDGAAAILLGSELGLNPIQSLQRIIPIHGMPSLEARTMVALLKAKGYRIRTVSQSDESVTVQGVDLDGEAYESTWTIDRARRAGYVPEIDEKTGKYRLNANGKLLGNEKYLTDPQAMLKAKAQAEVCRDMAPDVLMGISYTREELESERFDDSALPPPAAKAAEAEPVTVEEILGAGRVQAPGGEEDAASGQGGGNDQGEGAEPSSGADLPTDSGDQDPPAEDTSPTEEPEPEPAPEPAPAKAAAKKPKKDQATPMRKGLERRLFGLLGKADIDKDNREDRLSVYRAVIDDDVRVIESTDDLSDAEVAAVGDQLYAWEKDGVLGAKVTDILNAAVLKADAEKQEQLNNTEGE